MLSRVAVSEFVPPPTRSVLPGAFSRVRASTRWRSATDRHGVSPLVPSGTRKWIPASTCRRTVAANAASSTFPSRKGVNSAVPQPFSVNGFMTKFVF